MFLRAKSICNILSSELGHLRFISKSKLTDEFTGGHIKGHKTPCNIKERFKSRGLVVSNNISICNIPFSQFSPVQPWRQSHVYPFTLSVQLPVFSHGELVHSSISEENVTYYMTTIDNNVALLVQQTCSLTKRRSSRRRSYGLHSVRDSRSRRTRRRSTVYTL